MGRAQAIAQGARRTLGPVLKIEEQGAIPPPPRPMMAMRSGMEADTGQQTPITPGEIEVRAHVTLTVELR
jgi:uncharacterized protein YggE